MLELCKSYLTDLSQFLMYNGAKSDLKSLKCGVPQRSVLGPLFFIAYMNDILNASQLLYDYDYDYDYEIDLFGHIILRKYITMKCIIYKI